MNHRITQLTMTIAALTLLGAGCGRGQVAIPAPQANGDSALSFKAVNLRENSAAANADASAAASAPSVAKAPTGDWPRPTSFPGLLPQAEIHEKIVRIRMDKGEIVFSLLDGEAPLTVSNFVALARSGYFDGLTFHRVVPGFVIQGGDPKGDGTGGPGYKFEDEPVRLDYKAGIVAMANAGPDTNGSQFFIVLEDQPTLPKDYTIFGRVTSGMDIVQGVRVGDVMRTVTVENE